jgi:hypothetical protein
LEQVLRTACPVHARNSLNAALINLASLHNNFEEVLAPELIEELKSRPILKSGLIGSLVQWALIFSEIRSNGYNRNSRERLLTVRSHLIKHEAWSRAADLTLSIAALDASSGKTAALPFLQSDESTAPLKRVCPEVASEIMNAHFMSHESIVALAEQAGVGSAHSMIPNQSKSSAGIPPLVSAEG